MRHLPALTQIAAILSLAWIGPAALASAAHAQTQGDAGDAPRVRLVEPREESGSSMAVVVGGVPLAHTMQLFPLDRHGRLLGAGDPPAQVEAVLANLRQVLGLVGSDLEDVVKLNLYVHTDEAAAAVRRQLARTFSGSHKPAVSYVVTDLPHRGAVVALDAVALAHRTQEEVQVYRAAGLYGTADQGHLAVMPTGRRLYLSGQVAPGAMDEATAGTMQSLLATLAYAGYSASDVVQVKAFLHPVADAARVAEQVRSYFRGHPAPPFVAVEWTGGEYLSYLSLDEADGPLPIEIEILAARSDGSEGGPGYAARYGAPPWLSEPETYARFAETTAGDLVYVSGLYGAPGTEPHVQLRAMYETLDRLLRETGSDFDHLVKGTYYVTNAKASAALDQIRTRYYDPTRPPTSSKMPVRGTGVPGTSVTFDMIGVVPPPR